LAKRFAVQQAGLSLTLLACTDPVSAWPVHHAVPSKDRSNGEIAHSQVAGCVGANRVNADLRILGNIPFAAEQETERAGGRDLFKARRQRRISPGGVGGDEYAGAQPDKLTEWATCRSPHHNLCIDGFDCRARLCVICNRAAVNWPTVDLDQAIFPADLNSTQALRF
jgi:hypothetical protein